MTKDAVLDKLKKNMPDEMIVHTIYRDEQAGIYFLYVKIIEKSICSFVHLHDIIRDSGTTYFIGDDQNFSMDISPIRSSDLLRAVGPDIHKEILEFRAS